MESSQPTVQNSNTSSSARRRLTRFEKALLWVILVIVLVSISLLIASYFKGKSCGISEEREAWTKIHVNASTLVYSRWADVETSEPNGQNIWHFYQVYNRFFDEPESLGTLIDRGDFPIELSVSGMEIYPDFIIWLVPGAGPYNETVYLIKTPR